MPEWSYLVEEERAGTDIKDLTLTPSAEEVAALCKRLNLKVLEGLTAHLKLDRPPSGMVVHVTGRFTAKLTQACVVSLEPVITDLEEEFEAWFANPDNAVMLSKARRDRQAKKGGGEEPMMEEKDDPEPIVNGHIDLGELVTQYLSLALDPYPRAPGHEEEDGEYELVKAQSPASDLQRNPFAALKDWKKGKDGES